MMLGFKSIRAAFGYGLFLNSLVVATGCDEQQWAALLAESGLSSTDVAAFLSTKSDGVVAQTAKSSVSICPEITANVGPITTNARTGAVGHRAAGTALSYNPATRETCSGVGSSFGAGAYGRGSLQMCTDGRNNSLRVNLGLGVGIGADAASIGVTAGVSATVRVPTLQRAPITGVVGTGL